MSAKQARMQRRMMKDIPELESRPYTHEQVNPFPKYLAEGEGETDEMKAQRTFHNAQQRFLKFPSTIDPKRRLRRLSKSLRIPLHLLVIHLFYKTEPTVEQTEDIIVG